VNRRALEQLRRSRTKVPSATGVPTLPDNVAGVPIVITDSLSNAEAQLRAHAFQLHSLHGFLAAKPLIRIENLQSRQTASLS